MENSKTTPLHSTLELKGLRDQGNLNDRQHSHEVPHDIKWIIFYGLQNVVSCPPQRGGSNSKPGDYATPKVSQPLCFIATYCVDEPRMNRMVTK